jgi:hypothetical protein
MNDNHNQASDGEAKAKPEAIQQQFVSGHKRKASSA